MAKKSLPKVEAVDSFDKQIAKRKKQAQQVASAEFNVRPISSTLRKDWESCVVQERLSRAGKPYKVAEITDVDGNTFDMPLSRSWTVKDGNVLDIPRLKFCNLKDDKGKFKVDQDGDIEVYIIPAKEY